MSSIQRSAMILAGGEAKRVDGREKYFFSYKGCSFISRLVNTFVGIVDEIIIVAKNEGQAKKFIGLPDIVRCTWDKEPGLGPIGGIRSGIEEVKGKYVFIAACDMPTINKKAVSYLFENIGSHDSLIPEWENSDIEPLHAVYRVEAVKSYLERNRNSSLRAMIQSIDTKTVSSEDFRKFDPELETFRNVNTLSDLLSMGPDADYREKKS